MRGPTTSAMRRCSGGPVPASEPIPEVLGGDVWDVLQGADAGGLPRQGHKGC